MGGKRIRKRNGEKNIKGKKRRMKGNGLEKGTGEKEEMVKELSGKVRKRKSGKRKKLRRKKAVK